MIATLRDRNVNVQNMLIFVLKTRTTLSLIYGSVQVENISLRFISIHSQTARSEDFHFTLKQLGCRRENRHKR